MDPMIQIEKARAAVVNSHSASFDADTVAPEKLQTLLKQHNATLIAHYYTAPELQHLAEATGGFVGDSLEMARFGRDCPETTLIVAGVKFMGETAKILSPSKRVLMPNLEATCSLDLSCPIDDFDAFCNAHPDHTVVVYANTSAAVKARADWVVTSSVAVPIINHLHNQGEKIIWAPDKHLGHYLQTQVQADMLLWDGACIVHEAFKANALAALKAEHPDAAVLVHPESPKDVIELADCVGSTSQLIKASQNLPNDAFIVATERGIFYKMQQASPEKRFIQAPSGGQGATCQSCIQCPWMGMNSLEGVINALETPADHEIFVDDATRMAALKPLDRMLAFKV